MHSLTGCTPQPVLTRTLRHLGGQRGGDELDTVVRGAIVHGHLPAVGGVIAVTEALVHYLVQREATPQQHACTVGSVG